ncbi:sigma factor, partial [Bacteroides fragilis]
MEIEKDFIDLLTEHKALIYKVCFMYASNQEDLNDLYQEVVVNLWCSYPKFRYE